MPSIMSAGSYAVHFQGGMGIIRLCKRLHEAGGRLRDWVLCELFNGHSPPVRPGLSIINRENVKAVYSRA